MAHGHRHKLNAGSFRLWHMGIDINSMPYFLLGSVA
uniref:Uncharacterized protein n=1 Tax=Rhizophora mucronata TaxID=61149 RepID=A0A2P2Q6C4_RHIMU